MPASQFTFDRSSLQAFVRSKLHARSFGLKLTGRCMGCSRCKTYSPYWSFLYSYQVLNQVTEFLVTLGSSSLQEECSWQGSRSITQNVSLKTTLDFNHDKGRWELQLFVNGIPDNGSTNLVYTCSVDDFKCCLTSRFLLETADPLGLFPAFLDVSPSDRAGNTVADCQCNCWTCYPDYTCLQFDRGIVKYIYNGGANFPVTAPFLPRGSFPIKFNGVKWDLLKARSNTSFGITSYCTWYDTPPVGGNINPAPSNITLELAGNNYNSNRERIALLTFTGLASNYATGGSYDTAWFGCPLSKFNPCGDSQFEDLYGLFPGSNVVISASRPDLCYTRENPCCAPVDCDFADVPSTWTLTIPQHAFKDGAFGTLHFSDLNGRTACLTSYNYEAPLIDQYGFLQFPCGGTYKLGRCAWCGRIENYSGDPWSIINGNRFQFYYSAGGTSGIAGKAGLVINYGVGYLIYYSMPSGQFNPCGPNVLTFDSVLTSGSFKDFCPATLTVEPADETPCLCGSNCCDWTSTDLPASLTLNIFKPPPAWQNPATPWIYPDAFYGTFTLTRNPDISSLAYTNPFTGEVRYPPNLPAVGGSVWWCRTPSVTSGGIGEGFHIYTFSCGRTRADALFNNYYAQFGYFNTQSGTGLITCRPFLFENYYGNTGLPAVILTAP